MRGKRFFDRRFPLHKCVEQHKIEPARDPDEKYPEPDPHRSHPAEKKNSYEWIYFKFRTIHFCLEVRKMFWIEVL